ncbi:MAG: efflux RND transporter permease subunit, partial [Lachnospiraceae bacterium]
MLSKFSVKKPYTVVVGVVLIIILGIVSFQNMTVDLLPNMNLPYAVVMTTYQGASPEGVETVVTKPIEQTMATVSNIKNVNSTSQENVSTVILEFEQTANMDSVTLEMRERLDQIKGYWPEEVANPMIMKLNPTMMPVMVSAVSMKGDSPVQTSKSIEEKVIPEIESIEGVASVTSTGTIAETVQVTVNPDKVKGENENVRANLDAQFAKASQALEEAKVQVEAGKAELTKGQNEAAAQMGGAETEISKKSAELTQGQLEVSEKTSELEVKEVELNPLGLVCKRGTWYLVAINNELIKTYKVTSIESALLTLNTFNSPD